MSKTTFIKCFVPLLYMLTVGHVAAELKLTGREIVHPTGLIVAVTDTKVALENVPLAAKIRLVFNQKVLRNMENYRPVLVMKVDSTGVLQEEPALVPVEINGSTVTLDLSKVRLESMEYFTPDKSYLEGGGIYQVFIPWDFVQTETKEGLARNYGLLLNTRSQNKVDVDNTFQDGSNYKTEFTFCDGVLSAREMNKPSLWDIFVLLCPRWSGLKPHIPVMEDGPEGPGESDWKGWEEELKDDIDKEKKRQEIVDRVNKWLEQAGMGELGNHLDIPKEILDQTQKDLEEVLENYEDFITETGEFNMDRFREVRGLSAEDPKFLDMLAKLYEEELRTAKHWDDLRKVDPVAAKDLLRKLSADEYMARMAGEVGMNLEDKRDNLEDMWIKSKVSAFKAAVEDPMKWFDINIQDDIIHEYGKMLDETVKLARGDIEQFLTPDGKFNWDAWKNTYAHYPWYTEEMIKKEGERRMSILLELVEYEKATKMGEPAKKAFLLQNVAEVLRKRWEDDGKQPPSAFPFGSAFVEEEPSPTIGKLVYSITNIGCRFMGLSFLSAMLLCPGDARVLPVEYKLEKLDAKGDWVAAGVKPKITVEGNKLKFDYGKLPRGTYKLTIPKDQLADLGEKVFGEEICEEFEITSDGEVRTTSQQRSWEEMLAQLNPLYQRGETMGCVYVPPGTRLNDPSAAIYVGPEGGYYAYDPNSPSVGVPSPTQVYSSPISIPAQNLEVPGISPEVADKITGFVESLASSAVIGNAVMESLFSRAGVANNVRIGATGQLTVTQGPFGLMSVVQFPVPGTTSAVATTPPGPPPSQTTNNSGPKFAVTIKRADGSTLPTSSFTVFHGEKITIDFSASDPDRLKQVKLTAKHPTKIPFGGVTLVLGSDDEVLYEWKAASTNQQKKTDNASCSWKTTGTGTSDYVLEFMAQDSKDKTTTVTCPVTRLVDNGGPHVIVQNWGDECYFPSNPDTTMLPMPILVEGIDPPGSGIATLAVDVQRRPTFFTKSEHADWRPTRHATRVAHGFSWDCSKAPGDYLLTASATDAADQATFKVMTIHRPEDKLWPSVSITSPPDREELLDGATVPINVTAGDDVLVWKVELWCRQTAPQIPGISGNWTLLQGWERAFPAYRSGMECTYGWTCTNYWPMVAAGTYEISAVVWDASGKKSTSKTVMVTRIHDYDAPEVTVSISPSAVNEKENTNVTVIATIKERSLQTVSLLVRGLGICMGTGELLKVDTSSGCPVYTYRWILNTTTWKSGRYTVEIHATDVNKVGNKIETKEGVASGTIIVRGQVKQQPETLTNNLFTDAYIKYLTCKSSGNQSTSSSGNGTSNEGGGGGSATSDGGSSGGYYVWYTGGGTTSGTASGGDTQQSDSPADDTHHPVSWSLNIITEKPDGSFTQKYIDVTPGKRTESFVVYNAGDPNLFADIGLSDNNNNTTVTATNFGYGVILPPNLDGYYCSNCDGTSQLVFRRKDGQNTSSAPMLYSNSAPVFYNSVLGKIKGGSGGVAIQSAGRISRASQTEISGKAVSSQALATYNSTKDILCDEAKEIKKLTVNKNKNIITNISNKGTYSYSTKNGVITKAELTVRKGKVLTLPGGIYYLTKLTLQDGAKLNISGGTISLAGNATLYKNSELVAAIRCLPTAGNKMIEVWGNATLVGTILAPGWDVIVHEGARLSGGIICGKFSVLNSNDVPGSPRWRIN